MKKTPRAILLCTLLSLAACGDPISIGTELPGGYIVRERRPMPSFEACDNYARALFKDIPLTASKLDDHTTAYGGILATGQGLLQMCQYRKGEIIFTMAIATQEKPR